MRVEFGRPKSRGCIILNTEAYAAGELDDEKLVTFDLGTFTDPTDIDVLLEGGHYSIKFISKHAKDEVNVANITLNRRNSPDFQY